MAYNKNKYEYQRLTPSQETFCEEIAKGETQYAAYIKAYPKAVKWKRQSVDCNASILMNNEKVIQRLHEFGYKDKTKVQWTRQRALETINYIMDKTKEDFDEMRQAYKTEIDLLEAQLMELANTISKANTPEEAYKIGKQMQQITAEIAYRKKQRKQYNTYTKDIYEGAKILNRMFGFDITKVEIAQEDIERNEMEKLTVDELKELINVSKNKES